MPLPREFDPASHDVGFGGNIESQCMAGTYPECRQYLERHLQRDVEAGNIPQEDAVKRLRDADDLWSTLKKDPDVKEKIKARAKLRAEYEDAVCRAAASQISELRGGGQISLQVVDPGAVEEMNDEEEEEKPKAKKVKDKK